LATQIIGKAPPLVQLAHSRMLKIWPEHQSDMLAIAELLLVNGADVDLGSPAYEGKNRMLLPLCYAIGHADNMALGRLLLEHGANPGGTDALLRAIDFHDVVAVKRLFDAGALADEFDDTRVGGERPFVAPALHQAARRMCSLEMIELLFDAGTNPARTLEGCTAFGYAKMFGNSELVMAMVRRGVASELTKEEALLAKAADGENTEGQFVDPDKLPNAYRNIIRTSLDLPGQRSCFG
jgi:ankyrin repeat protein